MNAFDTMTPAQQDAWQEINDLWPIDTTASLPDGSIEVHCDDGDYAIITPEGEWRWGV